jgi:G3E family GTPase
MKLFLLGGFLGSGKTTAIQQAARYLQQTGKKVGVVTNDQGDQLVDTLFMQHEGVDTEEVTGSCFCCNFRQFAESIRSLQAKNLPDVVFAESVGSCTDLVATIMKPLLAYDDSIDTVLSVFADVRLLCTYLLADGDIFNGNMNYVYQKQLEEADLIVVNKTDTLTEEQLSAAKVLIKDAYPLHEILFQDSLDAADIQQWLELGFAYKATAPRKSLEINYDDYAAGEAEMAWYDSEVEISTPDNSAREVSQKLISRIYSRLLELGCLIGHLKFMVSSEQGQEKVSFTAIPPAEQFRFTGDWHTNNVRVLINGRVKALPVVIETVVADVIKEIREKEGVAITETNKKAFQPGYPKPTHRVG